MLVGGPRVALLFTGGGPTYYVSAGGLDTNDGRTLNSAWKTIPRVNAQTLPLGTTIKFRGGDTFSGSIALTPSNAPAGRVTITSYGLGQATISSGNSDSGISAVNIPNLGVNNIALTGGGNLTNSADGISCLCTLAGGNKLGGPTFSGVTISEYGNNGIKVYSAAVGFDGVSITNCVIHDVTGVNSNVEPTAGILVSGEIVAGTHSHVTITGNLTYNTTGNSDTSIGTGSGILVGDSQFVLVEDNISHDCGGLSGQAAVGIWFYESDSVIYQYNEVYRSFRPSFGDGGGYSLDGGNTNSVVQFNYSHDNEGYGYGMFNYSSEGITFLWDNNVVRFNISQNDADGLTVENNGGAGSMTNGHAHNNVIVSDKVNHRSCYTRNPNDITMEVSNNIFRNLGGPDAVFIGLVGTNSWKFTGNNYSGSASNWNSDGTNYTTYAAWQAATGQEKISGVNVGSTAEPMLAVYGGGGTNVADLKTLTQYQLQTASPMIGGGIDVTAQYGIDIGPTDFFGNAITSDAKLIGAGQAITWAGAATAHSSQATAFLNRATGLDAAHQQQYNAMISGMVADGDFDHMFALYKLATDTTANANLNLVSSSFPVTVSGSPTFTPDVGYTSNGVNTLFDTGFVPSTSGAALNSFALGGYDLSTGTVATDTGLIGATGTNDSDTSSIFPMNDFIGDITAWGPINFSGDSSGFQPNSQLKGLYVAIRTGAGAQALYKNGVLINTSTDASTALPDMSILLLSTNGPASDPPTPSSDQGAYFFIADGEIDPVRVSNRIIADAAALGITF